MNPGMMRLPSSTVVSLVVRHTFQISESRPVTIKSSFNGAKPCKLVRKLYREAEHRGATNTHMKEAASSSMRPSSFQSSSGARIATVQPHQLYRPGPPAGLDLRRSGRHPWNDPTGTSSSFYPPVRFIADPVSVDPLGSCAIGRSVFPEMFLGWVAIRPPMGIAKGRVTRLPLCIPSCASANVLGTANAMASATVANFMVLSFASFTNMATAIVAEDAAGCGDVGMMELGAGRCIGTTCRRISAVCFEDRSRATRILQPHSACRCQRASVQDIPIRVLRLKSIRVRGRPTRQPGVCRGCRGH
jgi:hypothetical protein